MSAPSRPVVLQTIAQAHEALDLERAAGRSIALTPTLGALHAGHIAHVTRSAELADVRIVSIFVNPTQFGDPADLDRYPRDLGADLQLLAPHGVDYVFAPSVDELYPTGPTQTTISAGKIGELYEGRSRLGHFNGVLTVVAKLLGIITPDIVTFGQKDAQQLFLVRRMIHELNIRTRVEEIETVREPDGLALSSRNRFLESKGRHAALTLSTALEAAASAADRGVDGALAAAQSVFMDEHLVVLDYFKIVEPTTFLPVDDNYHGKAIAIIAATVGTTRLIDNERLYLGG